ncbi:MAG: LysR family transcriptional regulator [Methanobrevibacter sp.]|jgi:molybdenum-dependent DNA-binding transcriptional regulator ModE|nr:LysR family transcriptional regulator [Methanobrevibacter sp.]
MKFKAEISMEIDGNHYNHKLFETLESINRNFSQRKAADELKIAHSVLNRRILKAEESLGFKLVISSGAGSELSFQGMEILNKYHQYQSKVLESEEILVYGGPITIGLLEYLSSDFPKKISFYSCSDEDSYNLAQKSLVDIIALDDPLLGFKKDLEFIPIAYDHLVLLGNEKIEEKSESSDKKPINKEIKTISDLNGLNFVSVDGTAQRLAWQTLKDANIDFNIVQNLKSQYDASKLVENSDSLYTFLNGSFFKGNEILKRETEHVLSLVPINKEKEGVEEFIDFILNKGQEKILKQGFIPIEPWKVSNRQLP